MTRLVLISMAMSTALVFGRVAPALATPITYTETATGTGSLGGSSFTDALVTISLVGDTTDVTNPFAGKYENEGSATLTVAGITGIADFTGSMNVYVFQPGTVAGISCSNCSVGPDVLDTNNPALATYALQTAIGPLTAVSGSFLNSGAAFPTTLGDFILTSIDRESPTFTATVVPEPASLLLLGSGVVTLVGRRLRRRR